MGPLVQRTASIDFGCFIPKTCFKMAYKTITWLATIMYLAIRSYTVTFLTDFYNLFFNRSHVFQAPDTNLKLSYFSRYRLNNLQLLLTLVSHKMYTKFHKYSFPSILIKGLFRNTSISYISACNIYGHLHVHKL